MTTAEARAAKPRLLTRCDGRAAGSCASIVPHAWQRGQRPAHLTDSAPHPLHRKPPEATRELDEPDALGRGTGGREDMARTV
ncbi:hypothetical protein FDG2_6234 [Candidatus Protofrankia californiensis]|uniref:Uncharacterized protein n=1 Tax=Candidatus Protofrankia californiensis TaxID=1839754 RepID=A0A1C3PGJ1_9ACTN|nr:hypothetical protein FDG2_6234 [Candidatus Protofrankia californiensis]